MEFDAHKLYHTHEKDPCGYLVISIIDAILFIIKSTNRESEQILIPHPHHSPCPGAREI